ncbi:putative baseplate assembly protein [Nostoc sp. FACHB-87]|uniref:putative baseplate assembly protein n=1 Tax=Nostocaceae TaxID=1162 RepID=UPI00168A157C|nr:MULTISPECIES: putative baseplate assembly protein [Nostocaceae]MBD2455441.1 putative baseplate assembly protein [Nostoc sp. FACHB-87]MBD2475841.1 putative baseplate assembly protein [Anabaena sp. FACHB-83]
MNSSDVSSEQPTNYNPPGLSALAYRIGTHPSFFQRLLAGLPTQEIPQSPDTQKPQHPLHKLTTQHLDDPAIALLDAWAVVGDVLTFYQERIANEGYLRTATEDRSILELSRTVGYKLNPGVAASTYLTFTVEDAPGSAQEVTVPAGTRVQSIPKAPGELPQTFETIAEIKTRVEWNSLKPDISPKFDTPKFDQDTTELSLQGTNTRLQPGDRILIISDTGGDNTAPLPVSPDPNANPPKREFRFFLTLESVETDAQNNFTLIRWNNNTKQTLPAVLVNATHSSANNLQVFAFRQQASLFGHNARDWSELSPEIKRKYSPSQFGSETINCTGITIRVNNDAVFTTSINKGDIITVANQSKTVVNISENKKIITVDSGFIPNLDNIQGFIYNKAISEWSKFSIQSSQIDLNALYPNVLPGSWVLLNQDESSELYQVENSSTVFRSDFELAGKVTRINVTSSNGLEKFDLRKTTIFIQSEQLLLFKKPQELPSIKRQNPLIKLAQSIPPLEPGRTVIIKDKTNTEIAFVGSMDDSQSLTLSYDLQHDYDTASMTIYANVVPATHGETVEKEVLGSGNGGQANQRFKLKKPPLTYVSEATASGSKSTLQVYVNNVLWQEVISLEEQDARSQCYIVQIDDRGEFTIIFGDGIHGSRLPSGQENIIATYRSGIGQVGEVKAGSLILLQNRPLGIRDVTNLHDATGAGDRETSLHIRDNTPRTVRTLDRIVSLRDFQNFTQSFAGIGKAQAVILWTGQTKLIHITIAADDGQQVESNSALFTNLKQAIVSNMSNPLQFVEIQSYEPLYFNIETTVWIDQRYQENSVKQIIESTLNQTFSFAKREFGQAVAASEVIEIIQNIAGVLAVNLDFLYLTSDNKTKPIPSSLEAKTASWNVNKKQALPSQLLLINPQGITLKKGS